MNLMIPEVADQYAKSDYQRLGAKMAFTKDIPTTGPTKMHAVY